MNARKRVGLSGFNCAVCGSWHEAYADRVTVDLSWRHNVESICSRCWEEVLCLAGLGLIAQLELPDIGIR